MRFSLYLTSAALFAAVASASAAPDSALHSRSHEQKMVHRNNMQVRAEEAQLVDLEKRGSWLLTGMKATWYGGGQLDAPACGGKAPKSSDYVVAVPESSSMKCGDTIHIHRGNRKMVSATVRDKCAGCAKNQVDMTRGLFSALGNLDDGVLTNLRIRVIRN